MSQEAVVDLSEIRASDAGRVGPKMARLGQLAADGTNRGLVLEEADRRATRARLHAVCNDLTALLGLLEKLEQSS